MSSLHQGLWVFPDFQSPDCFALCVLDEMETVSLPKPWLEICKSTLAKEIPKQVYMTAHRVNVFDQCKSDSGTDVN